jgi:hypothetical protein
MNNKKKNNIFLFSPGGYGPSSRIHFWADRIEPENNKENNDEWWDSAHEYVGEQDVDYGCYFMSREQVETLLETLKKLLEE